MRCSLNKFLRSIPSPWIRTCIRKAARRRGFVIGKIGTTNKEILADAIFEVLNEREHRHGPNDPLVITMRAAMNAVYDSLGWNETSQPDSRMISDRRSGVVKFRGNLCHSRGVRLSVR